MSLQFSIATIPLSAINVADSRFRISDSHPLKPLIHSIQAVGLLVPPLVTPINRDRYRIVSGFRRIDACQKLDSEKILVRIAATDTSATELVWAAISENALAREFTVMEKVRAVTLLQKEYPESNALTGVAQSLGIVESPKLVAKLSNLARLPAYIQQAVEKGVVGMAMALTLGRLESDEAQQLILLFQTLGLGLNRQREVLTLVQEIAKRESLSIDAVLTTDEVFTLLNNADEERTRCTVAFLYYLKKRRYPALTQREDAFDQLKKRLKLGPKTQLHSPLHFEGTTYQLLFGFDSVDDLDHHCQTLAELRSDPSLKGLLG